MNEIANDFVKGDKLFLSWMTIIPAIFIFNKDYVRQVLSKNDEEILNKGVFLYEAVNDIVPNSLLTIEGNCTRFT